MGREENRFNIWVFIYSKERYLHCDQCERSLHLPCVRLTGIQADNIHLWLCDDCRGRPVRADNQRVPLLPDHKHSISEYRSTVEWKPKPKFSLGHHNPILRCAGSFATTDLEHQSPKQGSGRWALLIGFFNDQKVTLAKAEGQSIIGQQS